jgi:hypothetical protein
MAARSVLGSLGGDRHTHLVDLGEVISEYLLHTALLFCFLLQGVEALQQEVAYRICRLELKWQYAKRREDAQEHLHSLLNLLHQL